jgi:predicted Zn-dependent protease
VARALEEVPGLSSVVVTKPGEWRLLEDMQTWRDLMPVPLELREQLAWELLVSRDRRVNAFALPGGYLGVHLGLIAATQSPDELASVLAHELSHVSQRHIARMVTRQNQQAPWMIGARIWAALAANASKNPDINVK